MADPISRYIPPHRRGTDMGNYFSRNSIEFIIFVAQTLDEIAEKGQVHDTWKLDHCDVCYDRVIGHFDQSKLQFVPGHLEKLLQLPQRITIRPGDFGVRPELREIVGSCAYGAYELRQLIVRSGVYHSDQLAGLKFTEHELSVNAASFLAARSTFKECYCSGPGYGLTNPDRVMEDPPYLVSLGDPTMDPDLYQAIQESLRETRYDFREKVDSSALTKVEQAFLDGRNIPTGRRKRSPGRRRDKGRDKSALVRKADQKPPIIVECYPRVPRGFVVEDPYFFPQRGKVVSLKFSQVGVLRKNRKRRPPKPRVIVGRTLPPREKSKYWYFQRTRGKWSYSLHHPLEGDPRPL
jgi:hypothetical protein